MEAPTAIPSTTARAKRTLYVGGLEDTVTVDVVRACFIPFGELSDVQVPTDRDGKSKGYAFVEFVEEGDAKDALDNRDGSELYGRTLRVNIARAPRAKNKAVWADADSWYASLKEEVDAEAATTGAAATAGGDGAVADAAQ